MDKELDMYFRVRGRNNEHGRNSTEGQHKKDGN